MANVSNRRQNLIPKWIFRLPRIYSEILFNFISSRVLSATVCSLPFRIFYIAGTLRIRCTGARILTLTNKIQSLSPPKNCLNLMAYNTFKFKNKLIFSSDATTRSVIFSRATAKMRKPQNNQYLVTQRCLLLKQRKKLFGLFSMFYDELKKSTVKI